MEVTHHPAASRPALAMFLCFALGIVASCAWQFLPEPLVTLPLLGYLVYSLLPFFAPTRFQLGDDLRISRLGHTRVYGWDRFRAFVRDRNGVFLTPYRRKTSTERLRGVFLNLPACEAMLEFLREKGLDERAH